MRSALVPAPVGRPLHSLTVAFPRSLLAAFGGCGVSSGRPKARSADVRRGRRGGSLSGVARPPGSGSVAIVAAAALLPVVTVLASSPLAAQPLPDAVRIDEPGLHPEGVEWDADRGRFLVSSVTRGTVTEVRDDGSAREFASRPDATTSEEAAAPGAIGIHIDRERDRLLVAFGDVEIFQVPDVQGVAAVGAYDLETGERIFYTDLDALLLGGRHFGNDVTVGPDGWAYVTDSFSPVIYRVGPGGEAEVFARDPRLAAEQFGLNGIEYHPDGYLIAAVLGRGALVRIPVDAPSEMEFVSVPEAVPADGLLLLPDGGLAAVTVDPAGERPNEVAWLRSDDGWRSAQVVARAPAPGATTVTVRAGAVYAVDPRFRDFGTPGVSPFSVFRVEPGGE